MMLRRSMMAQASGGATDPYWSNVSALLHMDGSNGSTSFPDETGKIWTPSGSAQVSTANAQFGQSALFGGSGAWIDGPTSSDFTFGTGDFTLECWAYWTDTGNRAILGFATNFTLYRAGDNRVYFFDSDDGNNVTGTTGTVALNQWIHVALVRASGSLQIYTNGVGSSTASYTKNLTSSNMRIGSAANGTSNMSGYIDEVRITKGVARYTGSSITVPSAPFPNS